MSEFSRNRLGLQVPSGASCTRSKQAKSILGEARSPRFAVPIYDTICLPRGVDFSTQTQAQLNAIMTSAANAWPIGEFYTPGTAVNEEGLRFNDGWLKIPFFRFGTNDQTDTLVRPHQVNLGGGPYGSIFDPQHHKYGVQAREDRALGVSSAKIESISIDMVSCDGSAVTMSDANLLQGGKIVQRLLDNRGNILIEEDGRTIGTNVFAHGMYRAHTGAQDSLGPAYTNGGFTNAQIPNTNEIPKLQVPGILSMAQTVEGKSLVGYLELWLPVGRKVLPVGSSNPLFQLNGFDSIADPTGPFPYPVNAGYNPDVRIAINGMLDQSFQF